jgi:molybdate transport system ATP-binding protein
MLISVNDITIQIGNKHLFEHTNWVIEKNQHWAIAGKTGSGKSTLAKAISYKAQIVRGQIVYYFDDDSAAQGRTYLNPKEILTFSSESHQDFYRRYSSYHQARWQSLEGDDIPVVSSLFSPDSLEPSSYAEAVPSAAADSVYRRRDSILDLFKLNSLLERKVHQLSHGESRKVLLARLLMYSPRLLILDDPYTGLDQHSRELLAHAIDTLIAHGDTQILFVSSRVEDIPESIDHLLVVHDSRVAAKGDRKTLSGDANLQPDFSSQGSASSGFQKTAAFEKMVEKYSGALKNNPLLDSSVFVQMENVSITYESNKILNQIQWTVKQGERWALLGHNGAGKTTLLSLILADNPQAYANLITLFGKRRGSGETIWQIKKNIGWVSPELQVHYPKNISCLEVVCSGFFDSIGLYRRCSQAQIELASGWIQVFGMEALADKTFFTLSTGQQRLILLARALVKNPPLLILDEPCQGLDAFYRDYFVGFLNQLCEHTPITLIYVTHYANELPASITHRLMLDHGEAKSEEA